jgi:hypothetical protein
MVAHLLVAIHVVTRRTWGERFVVFRRMVLPILPASALMLWSLGIHVTEPHGAMSGFVSLGKAVPFWENGYNLWAEWFWGFTKLSISSVVPCIVLGVLALHAIWNRHPGSPFFSPWALLALAVLYFFLPYTTTNWFHVNSRIIPFLWVAALVRVPEKLPRKMLTLLGVSAALYSLGMGADFVRLDADRAKFTAGMNSVPERSRLLPLVFRHKMTSENTRSLLHAWGFYASAKDTSMPLLFAHSRSFPVMYADPPEPRFNHLLLEAFSANMSTPAFMCDELRSHGIVVDDCRAEWNQRWGEFWKAALPKYDHVLMWEASADAKAMVPPEYRVKLEQGHLTIYERVSSPGAAARR